MAQCAGASFFISLPHIGKGLRRSREAEIFQTFRRVVSAYVSEPIGIGPLATFKIFVVFFGADPGDLAGLLPNFGWGSGDDV